MPLNPTPNTHPTPFEMKTKRILANILALAFLASPLLGTSVRLVTRTCPLDGTKFEAYAVTSFNALGGIGLDYSGSHPLALSQCPKCSLPLYKDEFTEEETGQLKALIASGRFQSEAIGKSPYFALGVLQELLNEPAAAIAWTYLRASWQRGRSATDAPAYTEAAKRAIRFYDAAAKEIKPVKGDKKNAEGEMRGFANRLFLKTLRGDKGFQLSGFLCGEFVLVERK